MRYHHRNSCNCNISWQNKRTRHTVKQIAKVHIPCSSYETTFITKAYIPNPTYGKPDSWPYCWKSCKTKKMTSIFFICHPDIKLTFYYNFSFLPAHSCFTYKARKKVKMNFSFLELLIHLLLRKCHNAMHKIKSLEAFSSNYKTTLSNALGLFLHRPYAVLCELKGEKLGKAK